MSKELTAEAKVIEAKNILQSLKGGIQNKRDRKRLDALRKEYHKLLSLTMMPSMSEIKDMKKGKHQDQDKGAPAYVGARYFDVVTKFHKLDVNAAETPAEKIKVMSEKINLMKEFQGLKK